VPLDRDQVRRQIEENIRTSGFHIYLVGGGQSPRFSYTIGLRESLGSELVLAGAIYYTGEQVYRILHEVRRQLAAGASAEHVLHTDDLGGFALRRAHASWTRALLLGALDYYRLSEVDAYQIVPDEDHWTIDVPDMTVERTPASAPMWRWLDEEWSYPVPKKSHVETDLDALRGARIVEAARWEDDYWEMFTTSHDQVNDDESRVVPLGCLLAVDPTLAPVLDLAVGEGLVRAAGGDWRVWD
jgi:hypothetical protein